MAAVEGVEPADAHNHCYHIYTPTKIQITDVITIASQSQEVTYIVTLYHAYAYYTTLVFH